MPEILTLGFSKSLILSYMKCLPDFGLSPRLLLLLSYNTCEYRVLSCTHLSSFASTSHSSYSHFSLLHLSLFQTSSFLFYIPLFPSFSFLCFLTSFTPCSLCCLWCIMFSVQILMECAGARRPHNLAQSFLKRHQETLSRSVLVLLMQCHSLTLTQLFVATRKVNSFATCYKNPVSFCKIINYVTSQTKKIIAIIILRA